MTSPSLNRLALGTVQFGVPYGVSNAGGRVAEAEVGAILGIAAKAGIDLLDTAAAYGEAEEVVARNSARIGRPFRIVSKTMPGADPDAAAARARVSAELAGPDGLDALLVHHPADLKGTAGDRLWRALDDLVAEGLVHRLGISAAFHNEPVALADRFRPAVMQMPVSLLDQRLVASGAFAELSGRGIELHARSVFLQGLIFTEAAHMPVRLRHLAPALEARRRDMDALGTTPLAACLSFALSRPELARIVVGVTSARELSELLAAVDAPADVPDWQAFALHDPVALDPSLWGAP